MALDIQNLDVAYGSKKVLAQLSGHFPAGEIAGILGQNGAGKTTFFKVLAGVLEASSGILQWKQQSWQAQMVAYLPTDPYFYPFMNGKEYLQLLGASSTTIQSLNQAFLLPLDQYVQTYSTGMRKKLAFLGVLSLDRPILLLDEPFNGVDLEGNQIMLQLLDALKGHKTILIASHILEALMEVADGIYELKAQKLENRISPDQYPQLQKRLHQSSIETVKELKDLLVGKKLASPGGKDE